MYFVCVCGWAGVSDPSHSPFLPATPQTFVLQPAKTDESAIKTPTPSPALL